MMALQSVQQLRLDFESSTPQTPVLLLRQPVASLADWSNAPRAATAGPTRTPVAQQSLEPLLLEAGSTARFSGCQGGAAASAGAPEFIPIVADPAALKQ
jgi:hypothetical protein